MENKTNLPKLTNIKAFAKYVILVLMYFTRIANASNVKIYKNNSMNGHELLIATIGIHC